MWTSSKTTTAGTKKRNRKKMNSPAVVFARIGSSGSLGFSGLSGSAEYVGPFEVVHLRGFSGR